MNDAKPILKRLIEKAAILGLGEEDLYNVKDLFLHNEFGLSLDTLVTQMYEYSLKIDKETYDLIVEASGKMELPAANYSFMQELIMIG